MKKTISIWRALIVAITLLVLTLSALPSVYKASFPESTPPSWMTLITREPIKLGLDLNGGVLFVLNVDLEQAQRDYLESLAVDINSSLRANKFRGAHAKTAKGGLSIVLSGHGQAIESAEKLIRDEFPQLTKSSQSNQTKYNFDPRQLSAYQQNLMQHSVSVMRNRIESLGITEAVTQQQGKQRIRIELPGVKDPKAAEELIGSTATLAVYPMLESAARSAQRTFFDENRNRITVGFQAIFTGSNITMASSGWDENGQPLVNLTLDSAGGGRMSEYSKHNIGKPMVTVFSEYSPNSSGEITKHDRVINVATIQSQLGNRFAITNMPTIHEAQSLATLLNAGSLNAPVTVVEKRTINPALGKENIRSGMLALVVGLGCTLLFMGVWYRRLGLIANVSLGINLVCLLGLMALVPGAVLTLPGIAGFVLTVGMAVDTNVLIFERVEEELKKGRSYQYALSMGYDKSMSTIIDANITSFLCAIILMSIGYGPVKGFAITLALGLITSVFSGVFVSKLLSQYFLAGRKANG